MAQKKAKNNRKKERVNTHKTSDIRDLFITSPAAKIMPLAKNISPKEQIFELLINYCDLLNETRAEALSQLAALSPLDYPCLLKECAEMLLQKTSFQKTLPFVTDLGFSFLLIDTLMTWRMDESRDLAKTMARLDKRLSQIDEMVLKFKAAI
jgi:hypothetical protein